MKKFLKIAGGIAAIAVASSLTVGCDKYFEDAIPSPNDPVSVTPALLLSSIEISTFATYSGQIARQTAVMHQQMAGTSVGSQSQEIANYNITELTNENEWGTIYSGAIVNAQLLTDEDGYGKGNPWYRGIAKVLMALNYGVATDLWGDVPFSEDGLGAAGNFNPKYDTQEDVIEGIQDLLTDAIADLQAPEAANTAFPGIDDFIFNGDVTMWIKTAHAIKARYANRLSKRNAAGSATDALMHVNAAYTAGFAGPADDANMYFYDGNSLNQWYAYEQQRGGYLRVCETFVDALNATSDPRLPVFVGPDDNGGISGTPYDDVDVTTTSYVGAYYASATSPLPLVSFVELKFIEAEAKLRSGDASGAAMAHNDAVKASVLQVTGAADPTFEAAVANETAGSITLQKIMEQKWVALFIQTEAYADWRRTGFPVLTPNPNGDVPGIPRRLITPQNERLYNTNAVVVGDLLAPVWWDQ